MSMPINHQAALAVVLAQYEQMLIDLEDGKTFDKASLGFRNEALQKVKPLISPEAVMFATIGLSAIKAMKDQ